MPEQKLEWNEDQVSTLKKMWIDGKSASQIAAVLGEGATRSSVIGKVHRLKLNGRATKAPAAPRAPKRPRALVLEENRQRTKLLRRDDAPVRPPAQEYVEGPEGVDVTHLLGLTQLTDETCKWPHGDPLKPGFGFCGKQVRDSSVYCSGHNRRAYIRL